MGGVSRLVPYRVWIGRAGAGLMIMLASCAPQQRLAPPARAVLSEVDAEAKSEADLSQSAPLTVLPGAIPGQPFEDWLQEVRKVAQDKGIKPQTLATALDGLTPSPTVVRLDRAQPEVKASYAAYLQQRLTPSKIERGHKRRLDEAGALNAASAQYAVPSAVVAAIWGMETHYGVVLGTLPVIRSLATLAYDGRRSELFRRELWATLVILDQGLATKEQLIGSWAGAFGQTQFLPSAFLRYGVDADGDGKRDVWDSTPDALASTANYLAGHGWRTGLSWGFEVRVPEGFDRATVAEATPPTKCIPALSKHSRWISAAQWRTLGFAPLESKDWPADETLMTLVEPDGPGGPAFLTTHNYRVLLDYNCSNFYALSVALLADALDRTS